MTAAASAAWRLHLENIELQRQLKAVTKTTRRTRCVYCGTPTERITRVCHAHADLPANDPGYHGGT